MKIINESKKEKLPVDFLTQFVSTGWNEIGNLTASKEAIKKEFSGTDRIEKVLQDLIDAYLVCVGQMELFLDKKNYLDMPKEEALKEDLLVDIQLKDEDRVDAEDLKANTQELLTDVATISDGAEKKVIVRDVDTIIDPTEEVEEAETRVEVESEPFEYFVDFAEPEPDAEADWAAQQAHMQTM